MIGIPGPLNRPLVPKYQVFEMAEVVPGLSRLAHESDKEMPNLSNKQYHHPLPYRLHMWSPGAALPVEPAAESQCERYPLAIGLSNGTRRPN